MNIPKGYKLVPVELIERAAKAIEQHHSSPKWVIASELRFLLAAAPTPPQPIYDEAKERELFEVWALEEIGPYFNKPEDCLVRTDHGGYVYGQTFISCLAWLACAQSRTKSVEVGHE